MLFNSLQFLIFLVIVSFAFFSFHTKWRWLLMLLASIIFYSFWSFKYLGLIAICILINYFAGIFIEKSNSQIKRQIYLWISVSVSISMLFFFKYFNFFLGSVSSLAGWLGYSIDWPELHLLLPVGISFYTFHILSYTIDVYRHKIPAEKNLATLSLYALFFPQLVAGPIARAADLLPQFKAVPRFDYERTLNGLELCLWGLIKKVVIADHLSRYVDSVFNNPHSHSGLSMVFASYFFAFQIYCDFSGYTDIAIGLGRIFNIELMINFRRPYLATSIHDFWRRWHLSLSTWFRDYLYIPLGGNRCGNLRRNLNVLIVFLISGLWHGANWTFAIWGLIHGIGNILSQKSENIFSKRLGSKAKIFEIFITFNLVTLAWIFFRANSMSDAVYILKNLSLSANSIDEVLGIFSFRDFSFACLLIIVLWVVEYIQEKSQLKLNSFLQRPLARLTLSYIGVFIIIIFGVLSGGQFIYFQF